MNILALDTSGAQIHLAALQIVSTPQNTSAEVLAVLSYAEPRELSRQIITLIDNTLQQAGWSADEVDALAVGLGPGSWTGLRIGVTTAKTLAQVHGWQLIGVPTFDAMAQAVWRSSDEAADGDAAPLPEHFLLLVTAPCRPGEVYGKIYECHPEYLAVVQTEWIGTPQLIADTMRVEALARDIAAPCVLIGAAAPLVRTMFDDSDETVVVSLPEGAMAVELGIAGAAALANGEVADPLTLQPLYLAPSAAERNLSV
jgi:tRNA threonylcarbamoyladenosine biosynthesis protein TsaB